jgi:hypothetical protein
VRFNDIINHIELCRVKRLPYPSLSNNYKVNILITHVASGLPLITMKSDYVLDSAQFSPHNASKGAEIACAFLRKGDEENKDSLVRQAS